MHAVECVLNEMLVVILEVTRAIPGHLTCHIVVVEELLRALVTIHGPVGANIFAFFDI